MHVDNAPGEKWQDIVVVVRRRSGEPRSVTDPSFVTAVQAAATARVIRDTELGESQVSMEESLRRSFTGPKSFIIQRLEERLKRLEEEYLGGSSSSFTDAAAYTDAGHKEDGETATIQPSRGPSSLSHVAPTTTAMADACQRGNVQTNGLALDSLHRLIKRLDEVGRVHHRTVRRRLSAYLTNWFQIWA